MSPVEDAGLGAGLQGGPGSSPTSSARMKGVVGTEPVGGGGASTRPGREDPGPSAGFLSGLPRPRVHPSPVHSQVFILLPFSAFLLIFWRKRKKKNPTL